MHMNEKGHGVAAMFMYTGVLLAFAVVLTLQLFGGNLASKSLWKILISTGFSFKIITVYD